MTYIGIKRKLSRLARLSGEDAVALRAELCGIASRERDKAIVKGDFPLFCSFSTLLGDLYLDSDDPSDSIRPYGLAYRTACTKGEQLDYARLQAVEGLATANLVVGEFVFALDCILEAIEGEELRPTKFEVADLVVVLTDAAMNQVDRRDARTFYDLLREGLWTRRHEGWAGAAIALLDHTFAAPGERPDYSAFLAAVAAARHLDFHDLYRVIERRLAVSAADEGRYDEAVQHLTASLAMMRHELPHMKASTWGVAADIELRRGNVETALDLGLHGIGAVLPIVLTCRNDHARRSLQALMARCMRIASRAALCLQDWRLLTELIEAGRLQMAAWRPGIESPERYGDTFPTWVVDERLTEGAGRVGYRAATQAIGQGDWTTGVRQQAMVAVDGTSRIADYVAAHYPGNARYNFPRVDVLSGLDPAAAKDAVLYSATEIDNELLWTVMHPGGQFEGGSTNLADPSIADPLAALTDALLEGRSRLDETSDWSRPPGSVDPIGDLSEAGSLDELLFTGALRPLVPEPLWRAVRARSPQNPLPVLLVVPPRLSCVPWAVLPADAGFNPRRLIEHAELQVLTPAAVRGHARQWPAPNGPVPVVLSVNNADGSLEKSDPVPAQRLLDGNPPMDSELGPGIPLKDFQEACHAILPGTDGVLFIRGHSSGALYAADRGILFADDVLAARDFSGRTTRAELPDITVPRRVVLALCASAGSPDASGLALGSSAACRVNGAEAVIASLYEVFDTTWSCDLDHRLVEAATQPKPLRTALRDLQLNCLDEWRAHVRAREKPPEVGPTPLVWAAYAVVV
jgi:hypothetical protein